MVITTWIISAKDAELQRKDGNGNVVARKSLHDADGYRCYSRVDDEAWRSQFAAAKACCGQAQQGQ